MEILIFFAAHWYLSLFCQTFYHHRYAAHGMFTMSPFWEKFFYALSWVTQGSSYLSPYAYGILHRLHHAHADTELDPHSPKFDSNLFSMMWRTKNIYQSIVKGSYPVEEKIRKNLPYWKTLEAIGDNWGSRLMWAGLYIAFYALFATSWWMFLLLPAHFVMGPLHGAVINWFAHKYGYENFKVEDTSKNLMPLDIFMLGEGFHNNHHKHPARADFGYKWFEFDPVFPFIRFFSILGIIKMAKA